MMKSLVNILLLSFLLLGLFSCGEDAEDLLVNDPSYNGGLQNGMYQDLTDYSSGKSIFRFREMALEEVQNLVLGKWRVVLTCNSLLGCQTPANFFHEYSPDGKFRIINKAEMTETDIKEWSLCALGYEIVLAKEETSSVERIFLHGIIDGVLHYSNGRVDSTRFYGEAIKEEE